MQGEQRVRSWWILAFLGTILFFLLLAHKMLAFRCLFLEDAWEQYWPWFSYLATSLGDGRLPLWEPHSSCGFPFHANPQAGIFYPVYQFVGTVFGGGARVFQYLWLGHWLFGIIGLFFLARSMGLSPLACFASSITFGFSGFFIGHAEHTSFITSASYVPWVLLGIDAAYERAFLSSLLAGVAFGMAGLSGYPGMVFYMATMVVCWGLLRYGLSLRVLGVLFVTFLAGAVVLFPAYVAFWLEAGSYTYRGGPLDVVTACLSERFPLSAMLSLIVPRFTIAYRDFIPCDISMSNAYFGVFGLVSLLVVVFSRGLRESWKWLLWWMLIAWLFSLGPEGGLRVIGYYLIPPLQYARHSALFRLFWLCGAAILTGAVLDRLLSPNEEERREAIGLGRTAMLACLSLCFIVFLWALVVPQRDGLGLAIWTTGTQFVIIGAYLVLFILVRTRALTSRTMVALATLLLAGDMAMHVYGNAATICAEGNGAAMAAGLERMNDSSRHLAFTGREQRIDAPQYHPNQGLFDRRFYVRSYNPASSPNYDFLVGGSVAGAASHPVRTAFLGVLLNAPRFWLTPCAVYASEDDKKALKELRDTAHGAPCPLFVHVKSAVAEGSGKDPVVPGTYGHVKVVEYKPERVTLQVDAPDDAWLFCAERYAPAWTARVDGHDARVLKGNFCFRAIRVPKGSHEVALVYDAWRHRPFWLLSWLVSFGVLGLWGIGTLGSAIRKRFSRPGLP